MAWYSPDRAVRFVFRVVLPFLTSENVIKKMPFGYKFWPETCVEWENAKCKKTGDDCYSQCKEFKEAEDDG